MDKKLKHFLIGVVTALALMGFYVRHADSATPSRDVDVPVIQLDGSIGSLRVEDVPASVEIPYCIESLAFTACVVIMDGTLVDPFIVSKTQGKV